MYISIKFLGHMRYTVEASYRGFLYLLLDRTNVVVRNHFEILFVYWVSSSTIMSAPQQRVTHYGIYTY